MFGRIRSWLDGVLRRNTVENEMASEMEFHLAARRDDLIRRGLSPKEALRHARLEFGAVERYKEECRESLGLRLLDQLRGDLRYAFRQFGKTPTFTILAVAILALGIGANTAIFSVVYAVLLRPLPYPEPDRIVRLARQSTTRLWEYLSIPQFEFWRDHSSAFSSIAAYRGVGERALFLGPDRDWIRVMPVTDGFFRTLGIAPALGREFVRDETLPQNQRAIILTDGLWRRAFAADPGVIGRSLRLDDENLTVVGVLPAGFWFTQPAEVFITLRTGRGLADTGSNTQVIARVGENRTLRQAQAEMAGVFASYRQAQADRLERGELGMALIPYQESLAGNVRLTLLLLFAAVAFLLLIACSNLACLLLARLAARQREIALRLALGSGRARLLKQFLTENLMLAFFGALTGLLVAFGLLRALIAAIPLELPSAVPIRLDTPVLLFTLAAALTTGVLFSLGPVFTAWRLDLNSSLKEGARFSSSSPARQRTRALLVIAQTALSMTLLVAAGLLIRTLYNLHQERLGFTAEGVVTFDTPLAVDKHRNSLELHNYQRSLIERLEALPSVQAVAAINLLPLTGYLNFPAQRDGHPDQSIGGMEQRVVTPEYFALMGIRLLEGRTYTAADTPASAPVILINESLARAWWPDRSPLGDRVVVGRYWQKEFPEVKDVPREIVGVVGDTKGGLLQAPPRPTLYVPFSQVSDGWAKTIGRIAWVVRGSRSPALAAEVRQAVTAVDAGQRISRLRTLTEVVALATAQSRFNALLLAAFAGVALALTAVGVYGMLAFSVAQRRHEIGIRMALGARRSDVLKLVLRQGIVLTGAGLALGVGGALVLVRFLATLLHGVRPADPVNFITVSLLLLLIGLVASYIPARRAAIVEPMVALRYE